MFNFFVKFLLHPKTNPGSAPETVKSFQIETYRHLPKKQIPFRSPFEKPCCK